MTDDTGTGQQAQRTKGRMDPADFAVLGLFLGVLLAHALTGAVVAASNGVTAILYANSEKFGWIWFSDRSAYADTLRNVDGTLLLATGLVLCVIMFRDMDRWWPVWIGPVLNWNRGRELSIPASLPVRAFGALGWLVWWLMALYALEFAPQRVIEWSREVILVAAKAVGAEFSDSTIIRLQRMDGVIVIAIFACAALFYGWAKDRCRRDAAAIAEQPAISDDR